MSDLTVILDRKELVVRMESKSIRVDRPDGPLERIPLEMIGRLILIGSPMVSCDVWRALAENRLSRVPWVGLLAVREARQPGDDLLPDEDCEESHQLEQDERDDAAVDDADRDLVG